MYYESLWNHVFIQQWVFNRLTITYNVASSINNFKNSWNCELQTANLNPIHLLYLWKVKVIITHQHQ